MEQYGIEITNISSWTIMVWKLLIILYGTLDNNYIHVSTSSEGL